ncbi:MAG: response regulator [Chloroflexota bacterium]
MFKRFLPFGGQKTDAPKASVFVVSDDTVTYTIVCETLSENGYEVYAAATAEAGLETLKEIGVLDLFIGDFARPEVDGVDFLKRVRTRLGKSTLPPVLFLVDAKDDETAARTVGAQELLSKPVDTAALIACVAKLVGGKRATDEIKNISARG